MIVVIRVRNKTLYFAIYFKLELEFVLDKSLDCVNIKKKHNIFSSGLTLIISGQMPTW